MDTKPGRAKFIAAFATIYLVWGSTYLAIRVAVGSMPPFAMASLRFLVAGALIFAFLRLRGPISFTGRQLRDNAIVGSFLLLGGNGLVSWAELYVPSGITALLIGIQPLLMVLTEWWWPGGKRPGLMVFVGLILGFSGVALLAAPWQRGPASLHSGATLAILGASVFWAFGSIYGRHARQPASPFLATGIQMLCGSLALGLVAALRGEWVQWDLHGVSIASWGAFAYLVIAGSLVAFSTFSWLMKHSTPARVITYAYVNPIVAVFLGWLILQEPLSWRILAASLVIVVSVVVITVSKRAA